MRIKIEFLITIAIFVAVLLMTLFIFAPSVVNAQCGSIWGGPDCTCVTGYGSDCPVYGTHCGWAWCPCVGCDPIYCLCCNATDCSCCAGCFTEETEVNTENSKTPKLQIKDLKEGDVVSSFNPETGEFGEGTVEGIRKRGVEGYYILETEGGKKVEVTGEHPFLAVKGENAQIPNSKFQIVDKFKKILSNTLTYNSITSLQAKISAALK